MTSYKSVLLCLTCLRNSLSSILKLPESQVYRHLIHHRFPSWISAVQKTGQKMLSSRLLGRGAPGQLNTERCWAMKNSLALSQKPRALNLMHCINTYEVTFSQGVKTKCSLCTLVLGCLPRTLAYPVPFSSDGCESHNVSRGGLPLTLGCDLTNVAPAHEMLLGIF